MDNQVAHFGYSLGLNTMSFTIKPAGNFFLLDTVYAIENTDFVGFNINMISNLRLTDHLDLRFLPGLNFGQRNLEYKVFEPSDSSYFKHTMKIESTFLDFPLVFKYRADRINNFRPYLVGGGSYKIDLASQKKISPEERPKIRLNRMDLYYEVGVGMDFFLEYFMFAIEVKGAFGILNMMKYDNTQFSNAVGKMNSKMLMISFHFEGGKIDKIRWWN